MLNILFFINIHAFADVNGIDAYERTDVEQMTTSAHWQQPNNDDDVEMINTSSMCSKITYC